MDLTTYTGLCAAVADYLARSDLTARIPGFITLAESVIKREVRRKTVRKQIDVSEEETKLPSDCSELRSIYPLTGTPWLDKPLPIGPPEQLADARVLNFGVPGRPTFASVIDGKLVLSPEPDSIYTYQITYYRALVPLSSNNPTNDVLAEAPDIYLYAALAESAPFLQHDERLPLWVDQRDTRMQSLDTKRQREELAGSTHKARLPVVF